MKQNRFFALGGLLALLAGCTLGPSGTQMSAYRDQEISLWNSMLNNSAVEVFKVPSAAPAGYDISVLKNDGKGDVTVISIPGAPSQHGYWIGFADRLEKSIEFYAVERPGYGFSGPGKVVLDFDEQVDAITPLLNQTPGHCNIVLTSSYAGPLALLTALREPDLVDGIIISAGLMKAPGRGARFFTLLGTAIRPITQYPEELEIIRREIVNAPRQRRRVLARLNELNVPVILLHGAEDKLVPPSNSLFLQEKLEGITDVELIIVPEARHNIMVDYEESLYQAIDKMIAKIKTRRDCGTGPSSRADDFATPLIQ